MYAAHSSMTLFNIADGYLDGILRGYRSGIMRAADYSNLTQCEQLDDLKMHLSSTDYGDFLADEPSPLHTTTIFERATKKLVDEFNHIKVQAVEPLSTFLDYITYGYMIDNIVLLISGTQHQRNIHELLDKCHPLGLFPSIASLTVANSLADLYQSFLVDTPLGPYLVDCISEADLSDTNIEIIRNTLYKAYLEDFYQYCQRLGGATAEVMGELLQFEADRRAINITINSFGTELTKDDRQRLYPNFGLLFPTGIERLKEASDIDNVRVAVDHIAPYRTIFQDLSYHQEKSLEDQFFQYEVNLHRRSFEQQFHYGVFLLIHQVERARS
eukprot:TRINITY_DN2925_c0_g1_i3.p1 TRINITY_DN2925_c0_g1~~TRINITY_DN2925_c0_g1_i3.p1  ORF type:complete len:374 (-),score=139.43 TRINITY_DN2925_c0_g1_i3:199-1182(-)